MHVRVWIIYLSLNVCAYIHVCMLLSFYMWIYRPIYANLQMYACVIVQDCTERFCDHVAVQGHGTDVYIYLWKLGDREVSVPWRVETPAADSVSSHKQKTFASCLHFCSMLEEFWSILGRCISACHEDVYFRSRVQACFFFQSVWGMKRRLVG
jgi:hypothetical protein